ncbi:tRNA A64-2'-O-ribosylphosphate transferase [Alternaria panax]|uniref:tRNA A64-2'-O-ribosylphosphate transferase n=1 Tax=Alternaria panax TaxID=48097 RepID=A0AAD4NWA6_9PLEO|nr:tRNA A64-2'-O-ribosylphosphate transferase [Alternaria panax]
MSQPLKEADIIFPHLSNTPNLSSTLSSLRRSTLSTQNRLASIVSDSDFVTSVGSAYDLPLVANERCGSWYIPPSQKSGSVYFKSTDGHMGEWRFSLRRLNLQLLDVVMSHGGAVVVDSTRRGKSMPDALSKTIPTWCCVINRVVFGAREKDEMGLFTPPQAVSESEHAQMEKRIDGFVRQFMEICKPNLSELRSKLQKPLRPIWVTQQSSLPDLAPSFPDFHPIVLCTASRRVRGAEASESGYIQGAADDHEAWSHGLTPPIFWKHKDMLMKTSEEDAPALIERLLNEDEGGSTFVSLIRPTSKLHVSSSDQMNLAGFEFVVSCTPEPLAPSMLKEAGVKHYLHFKCRPGKLGSRDLRTQLPQLLYFFSSLSTPTFGNILVCCPTGKDLSVGTALAILCLYTNEEGDIDTSKPREAKDIGKAFIKQRLSWITTSSPALNPSRTTLQSVNAVLLESQDPKAYLQTKSNDTGGGSFTASIPIRETRPSSQELEEVQTRDASGNKEPQQRPPSMSRNIFESLRNSPNTLWSFQRTLHSSLPTHPSGTVTGTATFTPCGLPDPSPPTLLYAEEGEFATDTGLKFTARRKYVYQLKPGDDATEGEHIAVRFFDDEKMPRAVIEDGVGKNGEGIGGLFVEMGDIKTSGGEVKAKNKETHLCAKDLYTASWKFGEGLVAEGGRDAWWEVRYDVKGPQKDYVSITRYTLV